jgi:hypothetical protein
MPSKAAKLRESFIQGKVYLTRTTTYISLINSGMILFLTLGRLKDAGIVNVDLSHLFFPLLIVGYLILFFIGWFEVRVFKGMQIELRQRFELNPAFARLEKAVKRIEDRLDESNISR